MLEFAGSIRLRMDVRDFLEFQCTFKGYIVVERTADVEHILVEAVLLGKRLDWLDIRKRLTDLSRDVLELRDELFNAFRCLRLLDLRHIEGEHEEQDELRRIGFR